VADQNITIIPADLALKHTRMPRICFSSASTFYRWVQVCRRYVPIWREPRGCWPWRPALENFGTWRDQEARLIWGVNDFDEAYPLPYTNDLVRLAVSAHLAISANHLALAHEEACAAILQVSGRVGSRGNLFVLKRQQVATRGTDCSCGPRPLLGKNERASCPARRIPRVRATALEDLLPVPKLAYRVAHRVAGLGSLGASATWRWRIGREAGWRVRPKALLPSACFWAKDEKGSNKIFYEEIITSSARALILRSLARPVDCAPAGSSLLAY